MDKLLEIGFQYAGKWTNYNDNLDFELINFSDNKNILYAFIVDKRIMYIGKSKRTLYKRMYNYKKNDETQSTNINNNLRIKEFLSNGKTVEIYVFVDKGLLSYGNFSINLSAGLEDSIIEIIQPEWNGIK